MQLGIVGFRKTVVAGGIALLARGDGEDGRNRAHVAGGRRNQEDEAPQHRHDLGEGDLRWTSM